jgi:hypothetical protein
MPRKNLIPIQQRRLIAERNVIIKEAFGSWNTGLFQPAAGHDYQLSYETLYMDLGFASEKRNLVNSDLDHHHNEERVQVTLYRRKDKKMISRILNRELWETAVHLGEHLIFKHDLKLCQFMDNLDDHPPPTNPDCAKRFKLANKKKAEIYTHMKQDSKKKRIVLVEEEDEAAGKPKRDPLFKKNVSNRDRGEWAVLGITSGSVPELRLPTLCHGLVQSS